MKCFWAYSNHPHKVKEDIDDAVKRINENGVISIKTWEMMSIDGNIITHTSHTEI